LNSEARGKFYYNFFLFSIVIYCEKKKTKSHLICVCNKFVFACPKFSHEIPAAPIAQLLDSDNCQTLSHPRKPRKCPLGVRFVSSGQFNTWRKAGRCQPAPCEAYCPPSAVWKTRAPDSRGFRPPSGIGNPGKFPTRGPWGRRSGSGPRPCSSSGSRSPSATPHRSRSEPAPRCTSWGKIRNQKIITGFLK